jgi:hypothetical protein
MRKSRIHDTSIPEIGEGKRGEAGHIGYDRAKAPVASSDQ